MDDVPVLPSLQEMDEAMKLEEILNVIERPLEATELWAILREVCNILRSMDESSKACQQVFISMETIALDSDGCVYILKSDSEPPAAYNAPEYELVGNSVKSHLFTLGMTILDAAYSNTAAHGDQPLSSHLKRVLGAVTEVDHDSRPEVLTIIAECDRALEKEASQEICRDLARSAFDVHSDQESEVPQDKNQLTADGKKTSIPDTKPNKYNKYSKTDFSSVFKQRLRTHIQSLSSVGSSTDVEVNDEDTCYAVEFSRKSLKDNPRLKEREIRKEVWKRPVNVCSPLPSLSDSLVDEVCESDFQESPQPLQDLAYSGNHNGICADMSGIVELSKCDRVLKVSAVQKHEQDINCDRLNRSERVNFKLGDRNRNEIRNVCDSKNIWCKENVDSSNVSRSARKYVGDLDHEEEDKLYSAFDESEFSSCDEDELLLLEASLVYDDLECDKSGSKMASPNRKVSRDYSAKMPAMAKRRVPGPAGMERTVNMDGGNSPLSAGSVTSLCSPTNSLSPGVRSSGSQFSYEAVGAGQATRPVRRTESRLVRSPSLNGDITSPPRMRSPTLGTLMEVMLKQVSKLKDRPSLQRTNSMKDTVNHLLKKYSFTGKNRPIIAKTSLALKQRMAAHRRQKQTAALVDEGSTRPRIRSSSSGCRKRPFHRSASDSSMTNKAKTTSISHSRQSSFEGLGIGVVLRRIGCGLPERELWAVCRECVLTILDIQTAPCISMDTVIIQDGGHISFIALPDNCDLDPMFLAPEAMLGGGLNEKTIVFSIAALLWLAADYNLSENQEPDFTDPFDDLMMSMTHDEPEMRPTLIEILEKCDAAETERREPSHQLCRILLRDAHNAKNYGRSNSLVQELMHEEVEQKKEISRVELLEDIRLVAVNKTLKPASERKLAEKPKVENLHDQLMSGIKNDRRLKPRTKPVEMSVREIYENNPNLMRGLKRVTVKANDTNKAQQLADVLLSPAQSSSDSLLSPSKIRAGIRAALQLLDKKSLAEKQALIVNQSKEETVEIEASSLELGASAFNCSLRNTETNISTERDVIDSRERDQPETDLDLLVVNTSDSMTTLPNVNKVSSVQLKVSSVDAKPMSSSPESRIPKPKLFTRRNSDNDMNGEPFGGKTKKSDFQWPSMVKPKPVGSLKPMQKPEGVPQDQSQMSPGMRNCSDRMQDAWDSETIGFQSEPSLREAADLVVSSNSGFGVVSPSSGAKSGFSVVLPPQGGFISNSNSGFSVVSPQAGAHPNSGVTVSPLSGFVPNSNSGFSAVLKSKDKDVNAPVPTTRSLPAGSIGTQVNNDPKGKGKVPKAFISPATHFTPIVLESETGFFKQKEAAKSISSAKKVPEKLPASGHYKKNDNATKDRNKLVADKLKELKKQLAKNQPPAHIVDDLENESSFETGPSGSRSHPNSRVTSPMKVKKSLSPPETELWAAANREVPVPAARRTCTVKESSQLKEAVKPKVISPCDDAEVKQKPCPNASGETNAFPRQPGIDFTTVAHLQDPKTGIVYAMIPVTKPVLPEPEKQVPPGTKSGRDAQSSKDHHNRRTSTSSDEEECQRRQPRRRRPERRHASKAESNDKPQQKTTYTKPEPKRQSRSVCKESAPLPTSDEPHTQVTRGRHSFKSDSSRSRIPLPRERAKSQERLTDIGRQRGERSQYPPVSGKMRSEFKRSVSEKDLNSMRVYGDIDIGRPVGTSTDFDLTEITFSAIDSPKGQPPKNGEDPPPEQVVPDLNSSFEDHEAQFELEEAVENVPQHEEMVDGAMAAISPIMPPSPSPPLSKDSGVSGLILKSNGGAAYPSLMDRLLNSDAMRRHEVLRKVVLLIREEFAFDGYMENGIEDLAMAEWLMSLSNVSWETFCRAVSEKYCDFYWSEELLYSLYDGINGKSPFSRLNTNKDAAPSHIGRNYRVQRMEEQQSSQDSGPLNGAASRAIPSNTQSQKSLYTTNKNRRFISDTSDSTDTEILRTRKRRARKKHNLDKNKSLSAGNLLDVGVDTEYGRPIRSKSQEDLLDVGPKRTSKLTPSRLKKASSRGELTMPKLEKPSNVVMDMTDYFVPTNMVMLDSVSDSTEPTPTLPRFRMKMTESETDSAATSQEVNNFKMPRPIGQAPILRRENSHEWRKPVRGHRPTRDDSLSSQSSTGGAPYKPPSSVSSQGSNPMPGSDVPRLNKTSLMCYTAEMQGQVHPDIKSMEDQLQLHRARGAVEAKMAEIDQQIMMENKMRRKSQKFHRKMMESGKSSKGGVDQRNILNKVSKEITEMTNKLVFLELARRHLEMLYAEQWGIDYSLMPSLVTATLRSSLDLKPKSWIDLIQYQSQRGQDGYVELQVLHAGTPTGLTVYLFAKESLSGGFIHEFFYCYRYFTTARELLNFIIDRYTIAVSDPQQTENHQRIQRRALDLLQYWVEGFYCLDFKSNQDLLKILDEFVEDKMVKTEKSVESLSFLHLLEECCDDRHEDFTKAFASRIKDSNDTEQLPAELQPNKKWKQVFGKSKNQKNKVVSYSSKQKQPDGDANLPNFSRPGDSFSLTDFSSQRLAEQLTLIEQALFRETHPVMFLNSKALGIGVASLSGAGIKKFTSSGRMNVWDGPLEKSLFAGNESFRNCIQKMIEHGHQLSHWVAAEILCCSSAKVQLNILTKFIYTAKMCLDMRNYATAISIIDALENYIVRQLPVWKTLPSKCVGIMEDLAQVKAYLKKDNMCLLQSPEAKLGPTIPCVLLFLLHVQQLEIGGFTLANGMYKWTKMRSIASVIDQLRIFKDYYYEFESSPDLEDTIQQRMRDYRECDLHTLASQHEINVTKLPSSGKLPDAFRSLKKKFQGKCDF